MDSNKTFLWREQPGSRLNRHYRIQTTDKNVYAKLKRRSTFSLVGVGINSRIWIFRGCYLSIKNAKKSLRRISGRKIKKAQDFEGFETC